MATLETDPNILDRGADTSNHWRISSRARFSTGLALLTVPLVTLCTDSYPTQLPLLGFSVLGGIILVISSIRHKK